MNKFLMAGIAVSVMIVGATSAEARDGCGPDGHRGPYGHCRPNGGPGYGRGYGAPVFVVGQFYPGRGYWDGRRFHHDRFRDRDGYRYR